MAARYIDMGALAARSQIWKGVAPESVQESRMLSWALTFFIVAVISAVLGFTSAAGVTAGIAKVLFFIFLVLTLVALLAGAVRGRSRV